MYEQHFGISGPPFQLNPDPSFYYDSAGHRAALDDLRHGVAAGRGIVVVTGEIGAGKTTIVRTVVAEQDPARLALAQIVSTQLEAEDLKRACLIAFGSPPDDPAQTDLDAALRRHLALLAKERRRAVLIVDEAQNLAIESFHWLLALVGSASVQLCLVGQPELRDMIASPELRPLREQVGTQCHLGPLDAHETGAYIVHRLGKVGWNGQPPFATGAFDEIHRWTHGIPRRINLLCNRIMLSCFLGAAQVIDVALVASTATDLRAEVGGPPPLEPSAAPAAPPLPPATETEPESEPDQEPEAALHVDVPIDPPAQAVPAPESYADLPTLTGVPAPVLPMPQPFVGSPTIAISRAAAQRVARSNALPEHSDVGPLLCVVASTSDHLEAAAMARAFLPRADLPALKIVSVTGHESHALLRSAYGEADPGAAMVRLEAAAGTFAVQSGDLMRRFEFVLDHLEPSAVIVQDGSDAALMCALVASRKRVPLVHVGAGMRVRNGASVRETNRKVIDGLADLAITAEPAASDTLVREGVPADRVRCVGNLLIDSLQNVLLAKGGEDRRAHPPRLPMSDRHGYGLVVLGQQVNVGDRQNFQELVAILREVSRDLPLEWPMRPDVLERLHGFKLDGFIAGERIACQAPQTYTDYVDLLCNATCVLTDSWDVQEEALALGIPCLVLGVGPERPNAAASAIIVRKNRTLATRAIWECIFNGGPRGRVPELWDGRAAQRLAEQLGPWLVQVRTAATAAR